MSLTGTVGKDVIRIFNFVKFKSIHSFKKKQKQKKKKQKKKKNKNTKFINYHVGLNNRVAETSLKAVHFYALNGKIKSL